MCKERETDENQLLLGSSAVSMMNARTRLSFPQVEEFHVYMLASGRINIAGLSEATIDIAADAIHAVVAGSSAPGPVL